MLYFTRVQEQKYNITSFPILDCFLKNNLPYSILYLKAERRAGYAV